MFPGLPDLVENVIFIGPHTPTDPSPILALPQLFVWTLWFSFLTLLTETLEEKGKKARMSQKDWSWQRTRALTLGGLPRGPRSPQEDQRLFSLPLPRDTSDSVTYLCLCFHIYQMHTHAHTFHIVL